MIADPIRTGAYIDALRDAVTPGCSVLDIGTGAGVMALKACQFGARRVYAIEPNPAILVAQEMAKRNGCDDRIEFIQNISLNVDLPERVDVMISDLRTNVPLFTSHLPAIIDARGRLLKPEGIQIPSSDELWAALVRAPEVYRSLSVWREGAYDLDMTAANRYASNALHAASLERADMASEAQHWHTLDYTSLTDLTVEASLQWHIKEAQTVHGLAIWFDAVLGPGRGFTNAPTAPSTIYRPLILSFPETLYLAAADVVQVNVRAALSDKDYVWTWDTELTRADGRSPVHYQQSNLFDQPRSLEQLGRQSASHQGRLTEEGEVDRLILNMLHDEVTLGQAADRLVEVYPERFTRQADALSRVAVVSERYAEPGR